MRLKAPVLTLGTTLIGALAHADEPVQVEAAADGYDVTFDKSTTRLILRPDSLQLVSIWDKGHKLTSDPKSDMTVVRLDSAGVMAVLSRPAGYATLSGLQDGVQLDIAAGPRAGCDADGVLELQLHDDGLVLRDCASGAEVTVDPAGFHIEVDGKSGGYKMPGKIDFPNLWTRAAVTAPWNNALAILDVDLDELVIDGDTQATDVEDSTIGDLTLYGGHHGLVLSNSFIGTLDASGALTGAAVQGTQIGAYDGPATFRPSGPILKKR